jgi:4-hydroxybenzoate polyprenyltransferase
MIVGQQITDLVKCGQVALAILCFGLCASSAYLINDVLDISHDRQNPSKRQRPIANGDLPVAWALLAAATLAVLGFAGGLLLPQPFVIWLSIYLALTLMYSLGLKRVMLLDVIALASLYTGRVLAGGAATSIEVSPWLLAFSTFFFLSLALVKRCAELQRYVDAKAATAIPGRGYQAGDFDQLAIFGSTSGYLAVLVLAFYIDSSQDLYSQPKLLWLVCFVVLYWISRVWLLTRRNQMHEDPIVFAFRDPTSYLLGGVAAGIMYWASR